MAFLTATPLLSLHPRRTLHHPHRTPPRLRPRTQCSVHPDRLSNHTILKPHQERTLLLQIRVLRTINSARADLYLSNDQPPTDEQLASHLGLTAVQLRQQTHAGIRARNDLVSANLRLVVRIATQVHARLSRQTPQNVPLEDLVQEGCLALIKAAELYDMDAGAKFSTFAYTVVYNSCLREGPRGSIVSIPERLRLARRKRFVENGVVKVATREGEHSVPLHLLQAAEPHIKGTSALDAPIGNGNKSFGDLITGKSSPQEDLQRQAVEREVRTACYRSLPQKYADILIMKFGLNGSPPMAGKDIAKLYGLSEPRIAQISLAALQKLRKLEPDLEPYIYDL